MNNGGVGGFTSKLITQVNTLDETSRIQEILGTNYTIGPMLLEGMNGSPNARGGIPQEVFRQHGTF